MSPDPAAQPVAGVLISDRYELIDRVAGGGMGDVWRATDIVLGRIVAIKFLRTEFADDQLFRERLRREARTAGSISHAGVVPVFDYGEIARDNAPYLAFIVMEFVDGPSLSAELSELGPLGAERTLLIIEQTAAALQAAHDAGIVHRDIKPGNILVTPQGDVKITDFGIARAADAVPITRTGVMTGTAKYLSPEQAGGEPATSASDIYSLGVVAYACLAGEVPFSEGNEVTIALAHMTKRPPALPGAVPEGLRTLVMTMLNKNPSDRPATAGAVAGIARGLLTGVPQTVIGHHPFAATSESAEESTQAMAIDMGEQTAAMDVTRQAPTSDGTRIDLAPVAQPIRRRRIATVVVALAVAIALAIVWAMSGGTRVPSVVGKQLASAEDLLAGAGLVSTVRTVDVAGKEAGIVLKQSADADSEVDEGSTVTLTVASGKVDVPLNQLLGATYAEASSLLDALGLSTSRAEENSTETAGTVIGVNPDGRVANGSTVQLTVAAVPTEPTKGSGNDKKRDGKGGKD